MRLGLNEELAALFLFPGIDLYWSTIRALCSGEFVEGMIQKKAAPGSDIAWKARQNNEGYQQFMSFFPSLGQSHACRIRPFYYTSGRSH